MHVMVDDVGATFHAMIVCLNSTYMCI